jgi:hypothetical protein
MKQDDVVGSRGGVHDSWFHVIICLPAGATRIQE